MKIISKKVVVSALVILIFAAYAYQQRHDSQSRVNATASPNNLPASSSNSTTQTQQTSGTSSSVAAVYKDGQYMGTSEDAFYGFIQVRATISGGQLTDIEFLKYPNDQHDSREINNAAMPILKKEAIKAQSSKVDIVSGATDTSYAFIESLKTALNQAKT